LLTNNEIVENIVRTINIKKLVNKVIAESYNDGSDDDLVQHIYLVLLETDNIKLNYLWDNKLMGPWIMQIILNERNSKSNKYRKHYNIKDSIQVNENMIDFGYEELEQYLDKESKMNFVEVMITDPGSILKWYSLYNFSGYSIKQKWQFTSLEMYRMYIDRKYTFKSLSNKFRMTESTVNNTLKYAKDFIKKEYNKRK